MAGFIINTNQVLIHDLQYKSFLETGSEGYFNIRSELKSLPIRKKNSFVLIAGDKKQLVFINEGKIVNVEKPVIIPPDLNIIVKAKNGRVPKTLYSHGYQYLIEKQLNKNNHLDDLKYSLKAVFNFNKPQIHFHKQFREVITSDYDTIVNGWVYILRTAFGKICNSIPKQNKLEFMLQSIEKFETIDFTKVTLLEGLEFLEDYVNRRLLSRGRLLVATNNLLNKNLSDMLNPDEIGFIDEATGSEKNISIQANLFKKLFDLRQETSIKVRVEQFIKNDPELEAHFQKIFSKETWPIDITK